MRRREEGSAGKSRDVRRTRTTRRVEKEKTHEGKPESDVVLSVGSSESEEGSDVDSPV